jgi:arsenite-transporting ATPase
MFKEPMKNRENPSILMFCGKGGVGKTTCASSAAIHYSSRGLRTLLISTDPSPSLSDILETNVKGKVTEIPRLKNLAVVELDYKQILEMWKNKFGEEVYSVISSFLPVEKDIIDYVAGAPGISEEFALSYVLDLYMEGSYDIIVWDTAPAGGTLSLLHLQETFYTHMRDAARLYIRVQETLKTLTGRERRDPLRIIGEWEKLAKNVLDMIRNDDTTAFLVTIPESLGVNQTERIKDELEKFDVNIGGIIVNHILSDEYDGSDFFNKRKRVHQRYLKIIEEKFGDEFPIKLLPLKDYEVKGIDALLKVEKELFST